MMNKKLLALAIGAVAALPATVLAAGPTLYGQIHVSLESVEDDIGLTYNDLSGTAGDEGWVLRDNASRIGVRGEADTGVAGLKGIYQAEYGTDATGEAGPFSQRNIFVGLQGGFGTLRLGKFDTPLKEAQGTIDQFDDTVLDMASHVANESRPNNSIGYTSPKLGELVTINVSVIPGEATGTDDGIADFTSISAVLANEGLYVAVAVDSEIENESMGSADGLTAIPVDATRFVAGYAADTFEAGLLYQTAEDSNGAGEDTSIVLSGAFISGDWKFKATYGMTEGDTTDEEITQLALGADYALGKSTTVNALFGIGEVDSTGDEATIFGVGLKQKF
ncbi:MAG: porin [Pseudomonadota bacterium]